jgi:DNA-directed RNA polymerase subunit M/transcription elongation factor TFIIS
MMKTLIIVCNRCTGLLLAKVEQKTRTCPYCGARVEVEKAKTMGSAENAYEASALLRRLKREAATER